MHNFNKYNEPRFNEIWSIVSKFNTINKFYSDFAKKILKTKTMNHSKNKNKKLLKKALLLCDELINVYKKNFNQAFKSKD